MVKLLGVHHFALSVADIGASIEWYRDNLGFTVERQFSFPELQTEIAHLISPAGIRVELLCQAGSKKGPDDGRDAFGAISTQGAKHIGLTVENVDATYAALKTQGITILHEPLTVEMAGVRNFWILDNEGHHIEFNEPLLPH